MTSDIYSVLSELDAEDYSLPLEIRAQLLRWLPGIFPYKEPVWKQFNIQNTSQFYLFCQGTNPCSCFSYFNPLFLSLFHGREISVMGNFGARDFCRHISGDTILATFAVTGGTTCENDLCRAMLPDYLGTLSSTLCQISALKEAIG